ncbi:MAG TPA: methionyl-tRNA formyltransferase [Thermoleophilaceae bacterium]|nr:methionyl-tRNA formyltransferase [Thermoleophilaceae bacterium]
MRTVYVGTSDFAAVVLDRLADSPHRPRLVVSRPDRRRGRGRKLSPPPVVERARELAIDTFQPDSVNAPEALERIAAAQPEAACVCAYGAILGDELLAAHRWLNVHPSLLPRWRGAAPIERAIEAGDDETGVAIMEPVAELDAGPVYLMRPEPIRPDDDYGSLSARLAALGGDLLVEALDTGAAPRPQGDEGVSYAEKIDRDERLLDPALDASTLERRVRALTPHVGAFVEPDGHERLGVRRVAIADDVGSAAPTPAPGTLAARDGRLLYGAADGPLELLEVQPAGGRPMDAADWLRGHGAALAAG